MVGELLLPAAPRRRAWTLAVLAVALAASACRAASGREAPGRSAPSTTAGARERAGTVHAPPIPGSAASAASAPPAVAAVPASTTTPGPDAAAERAARLELGTRTTIVHLFVGPAPEAWVREAGGTEPPRVLRWPLEEGRWLRGYGASHGGDHRGIDIGGEPGAPILAAAEGLVGYVGSELSGYGKVVVVLHPGGWVTVYGHASELVARPGQMVARGEVIARVGHTGNAGGDHLHFELRRDGHKVNPLPFLHAAPASVRSAEPLPLPRAARVYRVKQSDRLWKIARGSGMSPAELAALNGLAERDVLSVGHRLLIVRKPRATAATSEHR